MAENKRETRRWSLEEREYVGDDGKIHHHTHAWMEQHAGGSPSRDGRRSASNGNEERGEEQGGGMGRAVLAAAAVGVATLAAVALVTRRRAPAREPDIYPGRAS